MPSPCPTCRHAGPMVGPRTTCRAPTTEALVAYVERIGELPDAEVVEEDCPGWAARVRGKAQAQGLPLRAVKGAKDKG